MKKTRPDAPASLREVRARLDAMREEEYRAFASSLLPGVTNLLGVRLPALRRMARSIAASPFAPEFMRLTAPQSFEETMLLGLTIACAPLCVSDRLARIAAFVPLIDNWSVCDSFCISLKEARLHRDIYFSFLAPYLHSPREFEARFGLVMLLDHFVCGEYLAPALHALAQADTRPYYARMAAAWAAQTFYAACPQALEAYLAAGSLDAQTTALAVQKIAQSRQTDPAALARLRNRTSSLTALTAP